MIKFKALREKTLTPAVAEGFSKKEIKQAYGILNDPRYRQGNYSGAVRAIEKLKKGLSNHPDVANALRRANESVAEARLRDPADDDVVATDDDRKAADKNIVMQIRSVADLPKGGTIQFKDGKKTNLTQAVAKQLVDKFNSIQKPADKKKFQDMASASLNGLKQAVRLK